MTEKAGLTLLPSTHSAIPPDVIGVFSDFRSLQIQFLEHNVMEGSEGSIVSSFTPISQLPKARAQRHCTCPSIICIIVQLIQPLQVLCIDDGGPRHSLHLLPNWACWTRQAEPVLFSENTEMVRNSKKKIKGHRAESVTLNQSFSTLHPSFFPFPAVSSPCLPRTHFLELTDQSCKPLQSRITPQFPCLSALQTHNAHSLATF